VPTAREPTLAGVSGAMVFICGAVLASNVFPDRPHFSSNAIAVYFGGAVKMPCPLVFQTTEHSI
jgi:hypothetical protein